MGKTFKAIQKIDNRLRELHDLKAEHRKWAKEEVQEAFVEVGMQHCNQCAAWTDEQNILRARRQILFQNARAFKKGK